MLTQAPQLGGLEYAQLVSQHTQAVATDGQGMIQAVECLQATLEQMLTAYQRAFGDYRQIEQQINDSVAQLTQGLAQNTARPPQQGRMRAV
jgi:hypothetical protein